MTTETSASRSARRTAAATSAERDAEVSVVTAAFDADLREFYEDLGFTVRPVDAAGDTAGGGSDRLAGRASVNGREPT